MNLYDYKGNVISVSAETEQNVLSDIKVIEGVCSTSRSFGVKAPYYIVHLDIGSKYISADSIKSIIDSMENTKLNQLQLDFSKNRGFRFALDDSIIITDDGTAYDISECYGGSDFDSLVDNNNNYWLSQTDMEEVISYATEKGIEIVPCFTMPGNMYAFLQRFPEFVHPNSASRTTINFEDETAVNFIVAVVSRYAKFFADNGCHFWNLGCDEVNGNGGTGQNAIYEAGKYSSLVDFANLIIKTVASQGLAPRMWNDCVMWANDYSKELYLNRKAEICYWYKSGNVNMMSANNIRKAGFDLINAKMGMYYTPAHDGYNTEMTQTQFNNFVRNPYFYADTGTLTGNHKGLMWCVWFPNPVGITESEAVKNIKTYIGYFANALNEYA